MVAVNPRDVDDRPSRTGGRLTPPRIAFVAFAISVVFASLSKLVFSPAPFPDLLVYQLEGDAVRHGTDLYGTLPGIDLLATYPPFAGMLFVVLTPVSFGVLKALNLVLTVVLVGWVCTAAARLCGLDRDRSRTLGLGVAAVGLWCEPLLMTLHYGQINIYIVALVLFDFTRKPGSRLAGVGIGLACAIKVTPGIFIVYLLLTRRFTTAARAIGTFAATVVLSLLVNGRATYDFFTHYLFEVERVGRLENAVNQTVRGWLVRAHANREIPPVEYLIVVAVAALGLLAATRAYRAFGDGWGVPAAAVTGLLCSPISWTHHWVWCLPIFVLLIAQRCWWLLAVGVAIFFTFSPWRIPHSDFAGSAELHLAVWQVLLSGWYVLFGLIFLGFTLYRTNLNRTRVASR